MAKVKGNKAVLNNTEEKIVTKYDKRFRKNRSRREEMQKLKR